MKKIVVMSLIFMVVFVSAFFLLKNTKILKLAEMQNAEISEKCKGKVILNSKLVQADIYLVRSNDDDVYNESCLIVDYQTKVLKKKINVDSSGSYNDTLYVCDIDGDKTDEIIIQSCIGISGGAGQYISHIYKISDEKIIEIFKSSQQNEFDTGFGIQFNDRYIVTVSNRFTGYEINIDYSHDKKYSGIYYDENGKVMQQGNLTVDNFCAFAPTDVDNDNVYEIEVLQYASVYGHSDYIGMCSSLLKYDSLTQNLKVINTTFIERA